MELHVGHPAKGTDRRNPLKSLSSTARHATEFADTFLEALMWAHEIQRLGAAQPLRPRLVGVDRNRWALALLQKPYRSVQEPSKTHQR